jgi:ABC-type transport system involved in cytochrome c biogenesis permease subunit
MNVNKIVPWGAAALALAGAAMMMVPPRGGGFDLDAASRLPVLEGGRVKPLDSVARNTLLMLRGSRSFTSQKRTVGAEEWLLDVLFRPEVADIQPVFNIDEPELLGMMGIRQSSNRYYAFAAIAPFLGELERQAQQAQATDAKRRTAFQSAVVNLFSRVELYYRLRNTVQLDGGQGLAAEIRSRAQPGAAERQDRLARLAVFRPIAARPGARDAWASVGEALRAGAGGEVDPGLTALAAMGSAFAIGDAGAFRTAVAQLGELARERRPEGTRIASAETLFNRAQPFYVGMVIYVLALLVLFASWLWKPELLQPTSFALLGAGALVHTLGLVSRVLLQGRPPVTNLYSSAVFVGWCATVVGLVLEWMYRRGFGTAVAAASGFASLLVAHQLAQDGDTMEMMRAVLDSNFWLATHVVTITIGYAGTFLAGAIAIGWTIRRHLSSKHDPATTKALGAMTYGVICFALLFSFVGTVLGGIWADQSWGRFWGWDPKENGALLIVLWNAIILHARWGGYVRERGIMAMAIFGNAITAGSWFGVNMLGVGLHSYGFMDSAARALIAFWVSQVVLLVLALLPNQFWRAETWARPGSTPAGSPPARPARP